MTHTGEDLRDEGVDHGFDLGAEVVGGEGGGGGLGGEGLVELGAGEGAELGGEVGEVGGGLEFDFAVFGVHGWFVCIRTGRVYAWFLGRGARGVGMLGFCALRWKRELIALGDWLVFSWIGVWCKVGGRRECSRWGC